MRFIDPLRVCRSPLRDPTFMKLLLFLALLLTGTTALRAADPIYTVDFTTQPNGPALPWLASHGFETKLDFAALNPRFENGALWLSSAKPAGGLCVCNFPPAHALKGVKRVRITWGVGSFAEGADWEHGNNRTPLAIMVSFGYEHFPSGLPLGINPAPYFISPFLDAHDPDAKVYTGRFWKAGGRYVCIHCAKTGAPMISEVELDKLFQAQFKKPVTPPVSAIGFQMNTRETKGGASAFVKKIELLAE